jgi:RNA-binding protein NOB1
LPEVVSEIKDEKTRQRLQFIPYEIKYREPSTEDIKLVVSFAQKTGDYSQLSSTDIKLIALTLRLEKESNGDQNIREKPIQAKVVPQKNVSKLDQTVGFCGFQRNHINNNNNNNKVKETNDKKVEECDENDVKEDNVVENEGNDDNDDNDIEEEVEECDDSEEGWITPNNVDLVRKQMMGLKVENEVNEEVSVGCLTGDYAMQNVLMQMGLKVISIRDGLCIRETKQYVLRCFACFKISTNMSSDFCYHCGNLKTLKRVAVTVKDDGTKIVHINFKKPINIRGTRYSLPTPKSGKHTNNPILVADQPIPQQRKSKLAIEEKKQLNCDKILTDPDYVNRLNPFAINDIYSRASRMNTNVRRVVNPNETKKPTGNRKKKRNIK